MPVSYPALVSHLAKLAQLTLTGAQEKKLASQFSATIKLVSTIGDLKTDNVPATSQVTGLKNIFRPDVVDQKRILKPPPQKFYITKAVYQD